MEELRPEDLEELVQELEEEQDEQETLVPEVEKLLQDLQPPTLYIARQRAAEQLGRLRSSNPQIVQALVVAGESDSFVGVKKSVSEALATPAHQRVLLKDPQLTKRAQTIAQQVAAAQEREQRAERRALEEDERAATGGSSGGWGFVGTGDLASDLVVGGILVGGAAILRRLSPGQRLGVVGGGMGFLAGSFAALVVWDCLWDVTWIILPALAALVFGPLVGLVSGWGTWALVRRKHPRLEVLAWGLGGFLAGLGAGFLLWAVIRPTRPNW